MSDDDGPQLRFVATPPAQYVYRVKVKRGERWFDCGAFHSREFAQMIADRWGGKPGQSLVSPEPQER